MYTIYWESAYEGIKFTKQIKFSILKIFIYAYYFFRSIFLRGLGKTFLLILNEPRWEKKFNIKTSKIKKSESEKYFHYQGASYLVLMEILKQVYPNTSHFDFVDIGSGKGRAVFVAERAGFNNLIGIELDEELEKKKKNNTKTYAFKRKESSISFFHCNALEFEYKNKPTVYFLFNPFNEGVLSKVLSKISLSTQSETWLIYMNPLHRIALQNKNFVLIKEFKTGRYLEAVVYKLT